MVKRLRSQLHRPVFRHTLNVALTRLSGNGPVVQQEADLSSFRGQVRMVFELCSLAAQSAMTRCR